MISLSSNDEDADISDIDCSESSSNSSSSSSNSSSSSSSSSGNGNNSRDEDDDIEEGASSNGSGGSEVLETANILKEYINLPRDLCSNENIFNEFFSMETWNDLPDSMQEHLHQLLPKFPENDKYEKNLTLAKLFNREIKHFDNSPLDVFQRNLEDGNYRPDVIRLQQNIEKARRREQRYQESERISRLAISLMISREKLLRAACDTPVGHSVRADRAVNATPKLIATAAAQRAKKRYFQEIATISEQIGIAGPISDDENYPEGPPAQLSRKQKKHLNGIQSGVTSPGAETRIVSTLSVKGSNLDHLFDQGGVSTFSDEYYRQLLSHHKKRRLEEPDHPELDVRDINLKEIFVRTQISSGHRRPLPISKLTSNANGHINKKSLQKMNASLLDSIKSESQTPPLLQLETSTSPMLLANSNSSNKKYQQQLIRSQSLLMIGQQQSQLKSQQHSDLQAQQMPNLVQKPIPKSIQRSSIKSQMNAKFQQKLMPNLSSDELEDIENDDEDELDLDKILLRKSQIPLTAVTTSTTSSGALTATTLSSSLTASTPTSNKKLGLNKSNFVLKQNNSKIVYKKEDNLTIMHSNGSSNSSSSNCNTNINNFNQFNNSISNDHHNTSHSNKSFNLLNYNRSPSKPATLSDLEGYDMMHLPVVLDEESDDLMNDSSDIITINNNNNSSSNIINNSNNNSNSSSSNNAHSSSLMKIPELMQETHACFLSLIRDIFCSTVDHRMPMDDLKRKISAWLSNPITPLNDWYHLHENWLHLLTSAVHFLAGEFINQPEDYVPYLEYKTQLKIYQWIGAGRDMDQHLLPLCEYWFVRKHEMGVKPPTTLSQSSNKSGNHKHMSKSDNKFMKNCSTIIKDMDDVLASNRSLNQVDPHERQVSPPPPRFRTQWIVRKASPTEVEEFRDQEKLRYENPHMAFTYRQHNYESVVGPVKGIYTQVPGISKARGHTMLIADRPNFVTILTLVRDATARLPNGEGTRADICELLKSSQYISPTAPDQVLQTIVSGALDRMHTEHDPCVKYDTKRKIWIYLHRNRSEEEFERLHHQFQGMTKHKKITNRKSSMSKSKQSQGLDSSPSSSSSTSMAMCSSSSNANSGTSMSGAVSTVNTLVQSPNTTTASAITTGSTTVSIGNLAHTKHGLSKSQSQLPLIIVSPQSQPPALSSIQTSTSVMSTTTTQSSQSLLQPQLTQTSQYSQLSPPPLINNQQKAIVKSELVPIANKTTSSASNSSLLNTIEHIDVEASLDATPILIKSASNIQHKNNSTANISNLILENCQITNSNANTSNTSNNMCNSKSLIISNSNKNLMNLTTPIKITTSNGIQTVHVSNASNSPSNMGANKLLSSNQSILTINQSLSNAQLHGNRKIGTKSLIVNTASGNQAPPLQIVGQQQTIQQQGFILPISQSQPISPQQQQQNTTTKFINRNATLPPALTMSPKNATSLLQSKNIVRVQHQQTGKSLINPSLIVATNSAQQQSKNLQQSSPSHQLQQQVVTVTSTSKQQIGCQKTNIISTITLPKGQTTASLTQAQQKQFLQNILAVQQQQQLLQKGAKNVIVTTQQQAKIPALSIASGGQTSGIVTTNTNTTVMTTSSNASSTQATTSVAATNLISSGNFINNSQIIQIQQPHVGAGNAGTTQKIHTISSTNLTPQQQQQILQTLKQQHQMKQQQQSLIVKPHNVMQQNATTTASKLQQQIIDPSKPPPLLSVNSNMIANNQGHKFTRVIKTGASPQQQLVQSQQQSQSPTHAAKVNSGPIMTKVLTNNGSQLISLESLLQKQGLAPGTTLRVTGAKPGTTNLIQLTGAGTGVAAGSPQITQYAVLSQGRNLISVAQAQQQQQQRLITTQANIDGAQSHTTLLKNAASDGGKTTAVNAITSTQTTAADNSNNSQTPQQTQPAQAPQQQQIKIIQMQQQVPTSQQQQQQQQHLLNAKLVGLQSVAGCKFKPGIRMVNASNLNIANIGGKQVIIASKTGTGTTTPGNFVIGSHALGNLISQSNLNIINQPNTSQTQTMMLGGQLVKVQSLNLAQQCQSNQPQQQQQQTPPQSSPQHVARIISGSSTNLANVNQNTMVLANANNKQIKFQGQNVTSSGGQQIVIPVKNTVKTTAGTGTSQRIVLATQGQGGQLVTQQILLPNLQGNAINLKSLQGLKVIPIQQQGKDRPMFARILTQQPQQQLQQQSTQQQKIITTTVGGSSVGGGVVGGGGGMVLSGGTSISSNVVDDELLKDILADDKND